MSYINLLTEGHKTPEGRHIYLSFSTRCTIRGRNAQHALRRRLDRVLECYDNKTPLPKV
jgi:hypothetical protein